MWVKTGSYHVRCQTALIVGSDIPPAPAALLVQSTGRSGGGVEGKGGRIKRNMGRGNKENSGKKREMEWK